GMQVGSRVVVEYDVPEKAWYFAESGGAAMPFCVLLEAALQPCGWLASYVGCAASSDADLLFRNLDGTGTVFEEIGPGAGTLRTQVELLGISRSGGMILVSFTLACSLGDRRVFEARTGFGFFPPEAFVDQVGLPGPHLEVEAGLVVDLRADPEKY